MARDCSQCGKRLSFRDSFVSDGEPVCGDCLRKLQREKETVVTDAHVCATPKQILFSFRGRIGRLTYLQYWLALTAFSCVGLVIDLASTGTPGVFWQIFGFVQLWPSLAIFVKRWHDRDRSLWLVLLLLVPFVGIVVVVWMLVEVFGLKGTEGPNRFGPDPLLAESSGSPTVPPAITTCTGCGQRVRSHYYLEPAGDGAYLCKECRERTRQ